MKRMMLTMLVLGSCLAARSLADPPAAEPSPDEAAIRKMVAEYVEAFNKHDAKTLAGFWSPEAVYLNRVTGEEVVGREAIAQQFTELFKGEPDVKMTCQTESVQFVSPNVAVERGTSTMIFPKGKPDDTAYSAVYVKHEGKWLLDRVTDDSNPDKESHHEHLKPLEWMIGHWVDKDDHVDIETDCNWTKNRTYITRTFTVTVDGEAQVSGLQIVGWDPAAKAIRSWTFDSDGSFAQATWTHKKDRWFIRNEGQTADGRKASMTNVIKPIDDNSFTWQTIERTAGGDLLPNISEVLVVRQEK